MQTRPAHRHLSSDLLVIAGGLVTSAITLGAVYWLATLDSEFQIMGWYALLVIPVGAIIVGIGAGSGYGLLSWRTGRKVGGGLLATVAVLLVAAYAGAQWLEYRGLVTEAGLSVGFFAYYDIVTRSMQFTFGRSSSPTGELGLLGYLFRILEIGGFVVGGVLVPLLLRSKPYCEACSLYMRSLSLGLIPAAVPTRKIKKRDAEALASQQEAMETAFEAGAEESQNALKAAESNDAGAIKGLLEKYASEKKAIAKLSHRFELVLSSCPRCNEGILSCRLHSGHGNEAKNELVGARDVPSTVSQMLAPKR